MISGLSGGNWILGRVDSRGMGVNRVAVAPAGGWRWVVRKKLKREESLRGRWCVVSGMERRASSTYPTGGRFRSRPLRYHIR